MLVEISGSALRMGERMGPMGIRLGALTVCSCNSVVPPVDRPPFRYRT